MTREAVLLWLERALLGVGLALAGWCAMVLVEARYTQSLPLSKELVVTQTLPGDAGSQGSSHTTAAPAPGTLLARLDVPAVQLSTVVLEGSDDGTLSRGAGHIEDTPFPGEPGNIGIAGHRDTVFRAVRRIKLGDTIDLTTADRVYHYKINKTLIVMPEDVYVLDPTPRPTLTLVTCYPFEFIGHAPKRFIVQAELVADEKRNKDDEKRN
jgi:sortase A